MEDKNAITVSYDIDNSTVNIRIKRCFVDFRDWHKRGNRLLILLSTPKDRQAKELFFGSSIYFVYRKEKHFYEQVREIDESQYKNYVRRRVQLISREIRNNLNIGIINNAQSLFNWLKYLNLHYSNEVTNFISNSQNFLSKMTKKESGFYEKVMNRAEVYQKHNFAFVNGEKHSINDENLRTVSELTALMLQYEKSIRVTPLESYTVPLSSLSENAFYIVPSTDSIWAITAVINTEDDLYIISEKLFVTTTNEERFKIASLFSRGKSSADIRVSPVRLSYFDKDKKYQIILNNLIQKI